MDSWSILWEQRETLLAGFYNTLALFGISLGLAAIIGIVMIFLLEGNARHPLRRCLIFLIDIMRMLPFLIYAYLLYYGLPALGVRLDAWTAGIVALTTYHGAYFAEILRGLRATVPRGQVDAALAHGYGKYSMMRYLILPQIFLRSGPLLGNQLIYLLKDTAFLTIITVKELTSAASSIQSIYFIPLEAFIVAIGLYWVVCILIDTAMKLVDRIAIKKGISYE
ncbi:ABC transporter permease [Chelonobacter oris]|uniref:ABC transporter permease n=1 Tax=Chelonobacter oris TaxID=505317 RepID=A0A0A3AP14_9PAST|nr:amino acid ABC transporter permease [Chelonobacter oris]KGQ71091.1 ABC transporter permease [Chelonobacter oris]